MAEVSQAEFNALKQQVRESDLRQMNSNRELLKAVKEVLALEQDMRTFMSNTAARVAEVMIKLDKINDEYALVQGSNLQVQRSFEGMREVLEGGQRFLNELPHVRQEIKEVSDKLDALPKIIRQAFEEALRATRR